MGAQCERYIVVTLEWRRLYYLLLLIRIHRMQIMMLRGWIFIYFSRSAAQEKSALAMINSINKCVSRESLQTGFCLCVISGLCFFVLSGALWCCCCESDEILYLYTNTLTERVREREYWCTHGLDGRVLMPRNQVPNWRRNCLYQCNGGKQNWL
jgi:hypothetical protein